jgi:hypothetical protein
MEESLLAPALLTATAPKSPQVPYQKAQSYMGVAAALLVLCACIGLVVWIIVDLTSPSKKSKE